jgi:hypothetical protein
MNLGSAAAHIDEINALMDAVEIDGLILDLLTAKHS